MKFKEVKDINIKFIDKDCHLDINGILKLVGSNYVPKDYTSPSDQKFFVKVRRRLGPDILYRLLSGIDDDILTFEEVIEALNNHTDEGIEAALLSCINNDEDKYLE